MPRVSWMPLVALAAFAVSAHAASPTATRTVLRTADGTPEPAQLRTVQNGRQFDVLVRNRTAGPLEVEVAFVEAENMRSLPDLPTRAVLGAHEERLVARLAVRDARLPARHRMAARSAPGDPAATAADVDYLQPFAGSAAVAQGWFGGFSHATGESRYAVDFALPPGTPVLAARAGTVMQVESGFVEGGTDPALARRANVVRVLHEDGSMALYAHLAADGIAVGAGQHVEAGDVLALSGDTGFSSGPHLHFAVQVNRGMRVESVPFRMEGLDAATTPVATGAPGAGGR
ncbi:M23 family metallopeptidase [Coralloluteibacterium stylophorae]|uniref:M23 family metallopeptidase n=2 Tax=Coralloluteibacterium stylophorae TaxID=1776034 RepID=A0A8J7VSR0_9GAMM|nr:M23 family metallopeptidase [Coralloluteibacterium stylophorae]